MTKQIAILITRNGEYKVIRDDKAKYNPYKIYHITYELGSAGYGLTKHKRKVEEYADLASCMWYFKDLGMKYNRE